MTDQALARKLDDAFAALTRIGQDLGRQTRGHGAVALMVLMAAKAVSDRDDPAKWYEIQRSLRAPGGQHRSHFQGLFLDILYRVVPVQAATELVTVLQAADNRALTAWVDHLAGLYIGPEVEAQRLFARWLDTKMDLLGNEMAELGQFFTPADVVRMMVDLAPLRADAKVLDPACGSGSFLASAISRLQENDGDRHAHLTGVELNSEVAALAALRLSLLGGDTSDIVSGARQPGYERKFDLILSAPPFGRSMARAELDALELQGMLNSRPSLNAEAAFVSYAAERLAPGGRAAMLIPPGFLYRSEDEAVRRHLVSRHQVAAVIMLPKGVLSPSTKLAPAVIMLRNPEGRDPGFVTFVDAMLLGRKERKRVALDAAEAEAITQAVRTGHAALDTLRVAQVDEDRIRAEHYDLRPETYLETPTVARQPLEERLSRLRKLDQRYAELARTTDALIEQLSKTR